MQFDPEIARLVAHFPVVNRCEYPLHPLDITRKGEPLKNASEQVSRKSVADLVVKPAMTPGFEVRSSLGVYKSA